jgi:hypothetical protein
VTVFSLSNDTVHHASFHYAPRRYPVALLDRMASTAAAIPGAVPTALSTKVAWPWGVVQSNAQSSRRAVQARIRRSMKFPLYQPPVQELRVAADGGIWLRREEDDSGTYRWLLLAADATPVGELELASGVQVRWSQGDRILAVQRDSLDVPWLVDYRISNKLREPGA